jgi:hypothetical protein
VDAYYNYIYVDVRKPGRYEYPALPFSLLFEPILVGKGKKNRYKNVRQRSTFFRRVLARIIAKTGVDPLSCVFRFNQHSSEPLALAVERDCIKLIGRRDLAAGPLLNFTDGGLGTSGRPLSDTHKKQISNANRHPKSQATKDRIRATLLKRGRNPWSEEAKRRYRSTRKNGPDHACWGRTYSPKHRDSIAKAHSIVWWLITLPSGEQVRIQNLHRFCGAHGLRSTRMYEISKGLRQTHHGYTCTRLY